MTDDGDALRFAERVIALVDSGRKSATYKLATLLALIDVATERTSSVGPPEVLSGREVALRVIELYWPQTTAFGTVDGRPSPLRQSAQNDIPAKLAAWRTAHPLATTASLADARTARPAAWDRLERELVAIVIAMPLAKLQRFGDGREAVEDRFIYDFGWPDEVKRSTVEQPGFDDTIRLRPGVGGWLVRLAPLLRPLVQTKWSQMVARRNPDLVDAHQLDEFLFGASRISLDRVRQPLVDHQQGRCFYCHRPMKQVDVDHFLPWSRHPDNSLDSLVAAHPACNNAKSASLAACEHLNAWVLRTCESLLGRFVSELEWPRHIERTIGAVRATYLLVPAGARLWVADRRFVPGEPPELRRALAGLP